MARVLVIGGGGREHALAWKLAQSDYVDRMFVAPGNAGTAEVAENLPIGFGDVMGLLSFAKQNDVDLTVIGQEAASEAGVADEFQLSHLAVFGPTKAAARIETSKAYAKHLMNARDVPTAAFRDFDDYAKALDYLENKQLPVVIKASGLAEGKGVVVAETLEHARDALKKIMVEKQFGSSGDTVVIEEFLAGDEVSAHALCDDRVAALFPASQDHKQAFDGDTGPNTGGMGVVAPLGWVSRAHLDQIAQRVLEPTLEGLRRDGAGFVGCLYPGLMIQDERVQVVEFNARFGDPEAQTYMRLLDADLYEIMKSCTEGKLDPAALAWRPGVAISVALVSGGYPGLYDKGHLIEGVQAASAEADVTVFHGGTVRDREGLRTAGGRVLYVTAVGSDLDDARRKAYRAIDLVHFDGMHFRGDIGLRRSPSSVDGRAGD